MGRVQKERGLFDFDDMLSIVCEDKLSPMTPILIVDEFQDLTPIQYEIYKNWKKDADIVYIAGDPNQSIYGFWGADPSFFHNEDMEEVKLRKSHRLRRRIWGFAKGILGNGLELECRTSGVVRTLNPSGFGYIEKLIKEHTGERIFLETRTNYMARQLALQMRKVGLPLSGKNYGWGSRQRRIYNALVKIRQRKGSKIGEDAVKDFIDMTPSKYFRNTITKKDLREENPTSRSL